jgi:ketosteroid isomerase-like protein/ribosomal protein L40E
MDHEKPTGPMRNAPASASEGELGHNPAVDDLFRRLKQDVQHPKPGTEAIAAALQAVQRLASQVDTDASASAAAEAAETRICLSCGSRNPAENRFCAICGVPQQDAPPLEPEAPTVPSLKPAAPAVGQHHYHHHYHHHYFSASEGGVALAGSEQRATSAPVARDARARSPVGGASLSRGEAAIRKLTQDWALACNNKQLDDLVDLYGADAIVLRPNVPPVRGTAAIREFFFGVLDAGLGEVEMDPLRVEVFGDIAYEAGRSQMLVPFTMGKRREERGKYLLTLARQAGDWKILADCWSSDLSLGVNVDSGPPKPNVPGPPNPALKPPRKSP